MSNALELLKDKCRSSTKKTLDDMICASKDAVIAQGVTEIEFKKAASQLIDLVANEIESISKEPLKKEYATDEKLVIHIAIQTILKGESRTVRLYPQNPFSKKHTVSSDNRTLDRIKGISSTGLGGRYYVTDLGLKRLKDCGFEVILVDDDGMSRVIHTS